MKMKMVYISILLIVIPITIINAQLNVKEVILKIPVSEKPFNLKVMTFSGKIQITGHESNDIIIKSEQEIEDQTNINLEDFPDGFTSEDIQKLKEEEAKDYDLFQDKNKVYIDASSPFHEINFIIYVPYSCNIDIETSGGSININNIKGKIECQTTGGDIFVENLTGTVNTSTLDGKTSVQFTGLFPENINALSSFNGDIEISLPAKADADIEVKAEENNLKSELNIAFNAGKVNRINDDPNGKIKYVTEKWQTGKLNNGGTKIIISSMDGLVHLKKY